MNASLVGAGADPRDRQRRLPARPARPRLRLRRIVLHLRGSVDRAAHRRRRPPHSRAPGRRARRAPHPLRHRGRQRPLRRPLPQPAWASSRHTRCRSSISSPPLRIGPLTARNRVVCGAHFTMFSGAVAGVRRAGLLRRAARPLSRRPRPRRRRRDHRRPGAGASDHRLPDAQQRRRLAGRGGAALPPPDRAGPRARRARLPAARAQRRRQPGTVVEAAGLGAVRRRQLARAAEAARARPRSPSWSSTSRARRATPPRAASTASRCTARTAT